MGKKKAGSSGGHRLGDTIAAASNSTPPGKDVSLDLAAATAAVDKLGDNAGELVDETRRDRSERQGERLALKAAVATFVLFSMLTLAAVVWAVRKVSAEVDRGITALDDLKRSNEAAIAAQVKRSAANAAKQQASESFEPEDEERAQDLEAEAAKAELEALWVLPRPSAKVLRHLEKRAAKTKR